MNTSSRMAFLFPGQGSQHRGMGEEVANRYPESRAGFDEADCALGFSISQLCFEGTEEEIRTGCTSAHLRWFRENGKPVTDYWRNQAFAEITESEMEQRIR